MFVPDAHYVSNFLMQSQRELEGLHQKMKEIEELRYGESRINLTDLERRTGLEVRTLQLADMVESVKSAILANKASTQVDPFRSGDAAKQNSSKREKWHNAFLQAIKPSIYEFVDSQVANGVGVLKGVYAPWPTEPRERKGLDGGKRESDRDFNRRIRGLKQRWGPPFDAVAPHPMTWYFRRGVADKVVESLEHAWRPKLELYAKYAIDNDSHLASKSSSSSVLDKDAIKAADQAAAQRLGTVTGQPEAVVRDLPAGQDTTNMVLVTEYWSEDVYQVYANRQLLYEEERPNVAYFMAVGRSSSSKDPDKTGISVAEALRINEPVINKTLTRMAEAVDLQVKKRLTVELPAGGLGDTIQPQQGATNEPRKFDFRSDVTEALPAGAKVVDPFEGSESAYAAMPFIELLLQLTGQHGVSPIFKGTPPGAAGSGYRENSLYLMAKSQFQYMIEALQLALGNYLDWVEQQIVNLGQSVWIGELELRPKDIEDFPASIKVDLDPLLPQNQIAEAQLYMEAHARGHVTKRTVLEKGFKDEQPEDEMRNRTLEDAQELMRPLLIQEAFRRLEIGAPQPEEEPGAGLVDPQGNPLAPSAPRGPDGVQQLLGPNGGAGGSQSGNRGPANAGPGRGASQPPRTAGAV